MTTLTDLLVQHEGKTLEFKRDVSSPENIIRTVVAFSNGAGGTIIIGVDDRKRSVRGVPDPTRTEELLANLISDRIQPRLVPEIHIIPWRKTCVIALRVYPSSLRPHYVKTAGPEQGVYVRVGSTNRRADPAQVEEIKRFVRGSTFDEELLPEKDSEAIDFQAASECFSSIRKLRRSDLRTLQITAVHQNCVVPTVGGFLLFGRDRRTTFPDAYVRAGCFRGIDKSDIIDSAEIVGYLPLLVEDVLKFIQRNTRHAIRVTGTKHGESWEFPPRALREAVINALVHADYAQKGAPLRVAIFENRIEIDNPGGLPPGLTLEEIRRGVSKLRNRVIGRVFHELGLIEQWGSGIQRMIGACEQAGLQEPVFEEIGSGFRVTIYSQARMQPQLEELDKAILEYVRSVKEASSSQVAAHIQRTPRTARTRLNHLVDLGLLVPISSNSRDPRRVYRLAIK
jgi:predicted HTH transcriptional regulator